MRNAEIANETLLGDNVLVVIRQKNVQTSMVTLVRGRLEGVNLENETLSLLLSNWIGHTRWVEIDLSTHDVEMEPFSAQS